MTKAIIALEDGKTFTGRAFAGHGETAGELVFNTSMTGYQEILTDPSYKGQIVTLTYPLIGNYGVNAEDVESSGPHAAGLVVGEYSRIASNWRSQQSLGDYLEANGLIGVDEIDTRAITLHIRSKGAMKCVISTTESDPAVVVEKARASAGLVGRDLSSEVSTGSVYDWTDPSVPAEFRIRADKSEPPSKRYRVAVLDCGVKYNILRLLASHGCDLTIFPVGSSPEDILACKPDGLFISNGPGDPEAVPYAVQTIQALLKKELPTFGICFGHQLLGLAFGGSTYKLKFGHRGGNQPVMNLRTGKVEITSQNHGFCVDKESLNADDIETTHVNLNDGTSEGMRHKNLPVFSVQHHPEASPGPHDSGYLFDEFVGLMEGTPTHA